MPKFLRRTSGLIALLCLVCTLNAQVPAGEQADRALPKISAENPRLEDVEQHLGRTNGTGLLLKSDPRPDPTDPDPEAHTSYQQIFGIANGKFVPFSGPFVGMDGKPDAGGVYRRVGALGPAGR
jgi:hypothetical protein